MRQHTFRMDPIQPDICAHCSRPVIDHGPEATCEWCNKVTDCELLGASLLCAACRQKEYDNAVQKAKENYDRNIAIQAAQRNPLAAITSSKLSDEKVQVSSDIFNAEITSIVELRAALVAKLNGHSDSPQQLTPQQENETDFELAKLITERHRGYHKAFFEVRRQLDEIHSKMKADAQALNDLAGKLTKEQQAETKLKDINYPIKETPVKPVHKPKAVKAKVSMEDHIINLIIASSLNTQAQALIKQGICQTLDEGREIIKKRGQVMTAAQAREIAIKGNMISN